MDRDRFKAPADSSTQPPAQAPQHEQAWADWLHDDATPGSKPVEPLKPLAERLPDVTIEIKMPKLHLPKRRAKPTTTSVPARPRVSLRTSAQRLMLPVITGLKSLKRLRTLVTVVVIVLVTGGGFGAYRFLTASPNAAPVAAHKTKSTAKSTSQTVQIDPTSVSQAPTYTPIVPATEASLALGKQGRTAYDASRNSFSFSDTYLGNSLTVSEQQMPQTTGAPASVVTKAASAVKATQQAQSSRYGTIYIESDTKSNSQTIVLGSSTVLVFIVSPFAHSASDWVTYIDSLQ